jgi:hypothetical protein
MWTWSPWLSSNSALLNVIPESVMTLAKSASIYTKHMPFERMPKCTTAFMRERLGWKVELRDLERRKCRVQDFANRRDLCSVNDPQVTLNVSFQKSVLLEATPE